MGLLLPRMYYFPPPCSIAPPGPNQISGLTRIRPCRTFPSLAVYAHALVVGFLSGFVGRDIYNSYLQLPTAWEARSRHSRRKKVLLLFSALAFAGLVQAVYTGASYLILSYKVWAVEYGFEPPPNSTLGISSF